MTGETPMFEIAAEGELFDTRPLTVAKQSSAEPSTPDGSVCPACGRPSRQASECDACMTAGHQAGRLPMKEG
jgi:hypothetical protein